MEKAGSLHASVPSPPPRLYLPRHFSCSACLYGRLAEPCKGGGCSPEPEPVEVAAAAAEEAPATRTLSPSPPPLSPEEEKEEKESPAGGTATAHPPGPPSPPARGREPTVPPVPPSPTLRRRAKSLPTPGERGLRPALQHHQHHQQSPARRKTVRFADALGLELTAVRHFCRGDAPGPEAGSGSGRSSSSALLKTRKPPALALELLLLSSGAGFPGRFGPPAPVLEPLFPPPPGAHGPAFAESLRRAKVRLEWVRPEAAALRGAVRVLNLAYEKRVSVRYTLDRWASCREVPAAYQPPPDDHPDDSPGDRFVFHLPVGADATSLEFAVRYRVDGAEFWDNNDGHNYKLRARPRPPDNGPEPGGGGGGGGGGGAWIHFI